MGIFGGSEDRDARRTAQIEARNREIDRQERLREHQSRIADYVRERDKKKGIERARSAPKWEYLLVDDLEADKLDMFGSVGWELVNMNSYTTGGGIGGSSVMKVHFRSVLKRPVPETYSDEVLALDAEINRLMTEDPTAG